MIKCYDGEGILDVKVLDKGRREKVGQEHTFEISFIILLKLSNDHQELIVCWGAKTKLESLTFLGSLSVDFCNMEKVHRYFTSTEEQISKSPLILAFISLSGILPRAILGMFLGNKLFFQIFYSLPGNLCAGPELLPLCLSLKFVSHIFSFLNICLY